MAASHSEFKHWKTQSYALAVAKHPERRAQFTTSSGIVFEPCAG